MSLFIWSLTCLGNKHNEYFNDYIEHLYIKHYNNGIKIELRLYLQ